MFSYFPFHFLADLRIVLQVLFRILPALSDLGVVVRVPCSAFYDYAAVRRQIQNISFSGNPFAEHDIKFCLPERRRVVEERRQEYRAAYPLETHRAEKRHSWKAVPGRQSPRTASFFQKNSNETAGPGGRKKPEPYRRAQDAAVPRFCPFLSPFRPDMVILPALGGFFFPFSVRYFSTFFISPVEK